MQWSWTIRRGYLHIPHWSDIQTSIFFLPLCHLPAIVSVRIDNYSEHNSLCYFSVQVMGTIPVALRLKFFNENENELLLLLRHLPFSCVYHFKCHFLRTEKSYVFFLNGWKRLHLYWICIAIGFHLQPTYPKQMSLFLLCLKMICLCSKSHNFNHKTKMTILVMK